MRFFLFIFLMVSSFLLNSCGNESVEPDAPELPPEPTNCTLEEYIVTGWAHTLERNSQGQVSRVDINYVGENPDLAYSETFLLNWDSQNRLIEIIGDKSSSQIIYEEDSTRTITDLPDNLQYHYGNSVYSLGNNGRVVNSSKGGEIKKEYTYHPNGNVKRVSTRNINGEMQLTYENTEYSLIEDPRASLPLTMVVLYLPSDPQKNEYSVIYSPINPNLLPKVVTSLNGNNEVSTQYQIEVNELGYPISSSRIDSESVILEFSYTCE